MNNTLAEIVANKKTEIESRKSALEPAALREMTVNAKGNFITALKEPGINLITEIKPKSPSAGDLRTDFDPAQISLVYARYAAAISVLTDSKYFGGSLDLLQKVATTVDIPVLCKDFFLDPYQVFEARKAGAEAILLIVKILDDEQLLTLHSCAQNLKMAAVVEIQNEEELQRAMAINAQVILINNRDLGTFETDLGTTARLAGMISDDVVVISASGIEARSDIDYLQQYAHNFLIGSSLMRAPDLEAKLKELKGSSAKVTAGDSTCRA